MERSETFTPLNGLRFLAALAVVIFHYSTRIDGYDRTPSMIKTSDKQGPGGGRFLFRSFGVRAGLSTSPNEPACEQSKGILLGKVYSPIPGLLDLPSTILADSGPTISSSIAAGIWGTAHVHPQCDFVMPDVAVLDPARPSLERTELVPVGRSIPVYHFPLYCPSFNKNPPNGLPSSFCSQPG